VPFSLRSPDQRNSRPGLPVFPTGCLRLQAVHYPIEKQSNLTFRALKPQKAGKQFAFS
jgi:hypothetical protein